MIQNIIPTCLANNRIDLLQSLNYEMPIFNIMGKEVGTFTDLQKTLAQHGLTGGSYEPYLRAVLEPLIEAGWAACVVNSRGCAKSKITTGVLYNARATWDCRQVVAWCRKTWPKRKLYGIGFSLGANMLTNVSVRCNGTGEPYRSHDLN